MAQQMKMTLNQLFKYIAARDVTTQEAICTKVGYTKGGFSSMLKRDNIRVKSLIKMLKGAGEELKILGYTVKIDETKELMTYELMADFKKLKRSFDIRLKSGEVITIVKAK